MKGYLAPYKGQKYHIFEWQHVRQSVGAKEVFNYAHSSLRNVIERSFGVLKMKWRILLNLPSFSSLRKQSKIIIACMVVTPGFGRQTECEPSMCQDQKLTYTVIT
jgi:transposase-like protein